VRRSLALSDDLEQHLIAQLRDDPEAFRDLYHHYLPRVYAYIAYRVGSATDAEDLTAETFMQVVRAVGSFEYRGMGSFAAWVFRIAQHQVAAFYRQRRITAMISLDDLPEIISPSPTPEASVQRQERFMPESQG
jgi:RNA polymerase sigma-70 factor (ECF subfamily)